MFCTFVGGLKMMCVLKKIGILGGGQLGKMLLQNALRYPVEMGFLDPNPKASCAPYCTGFQVGDFTDYDTVLAFGKDFDYVGIEIENVNISALEELQRQGKTVVPDPKVLRIIQDKGVQKQFYIDHNIPTAPIASDRPPFVNKLRTGGYDGKGVQVIRTDAELGNCFDAPSINEELANIKKELAVIVVRNSQGETVVFDVVEQVFDPQLNVLDYLLTPAEIPEKIEKRAREVGIAVANALDSPGIFAIELFWNQDDSIWVNETAPRVHNSGHSSIENSGSSQFDAYLRAVLNLSFGDVTAVQKSAMINLIGQKNQTPSSLNTWEELSKIPNASIHWYGKLDEKKGRKMGHLTLCSDSYSALKEDIIRVKKILENG